MIAAASSSAFVLVGLVLLCGGLVSRSSAQVVVLNHENFDQTQQGQWVVEFFAPWCGHCKRLAPILDDVAAQVTQEGSSLRIGTVDATIEKRLGSRFEVRGYPTIKLFLDGQVRPYKGGRTKRAFLALRDQLEAPAWSELGQDAVKLDFPAETAVQFLFIGDEDDDSAELFRTVAQAHIDRSHIAFRTAARDHQALPALIADFDPSDEQHAVAVSQEDGVLATLWAPFTQDKLTEFVRANQFPLVAEMAPANYDDLFGQGLLTAVAVVKPRTKPTRKFLAALRQVAQNRRDQFAFVWLDGPAYAKWVEKFAISAERDLPALFVFDEPDESYYTPLPDQPKIRTADHIDAFLSQVLSGDIPATGRSWYNFARWFKRVETWMASTFTDTQMIIGLISAVVVPFSVLALCTWRTMREETPKAGASASQKKRQ